MAFTQLMKKNHDFRVSLDFGCSVHLSLDSPSCCGVQISDVLSVKSMFVTLLSMTQKSVYREFRLVVNVSKMCLQIWLL